MKIILGSVCVSISFDGIKISKTRFSFINLNSTIKIGQNPEFSV